LKKKKSAKRGHIQKKAKTDRTKGRGLEQGKETTPLSRGPKNQSQGNKWKRVEKDPRARGERGEKKGLRWKKKTAAQTRAKKKDNMWISQSAPGPLAPVRDRLMKRGRG